MNVSPIIDNYGYLMYSMDTQKTKNSGKDFQQFLLEEIFGPALVPDTAFINTEDLDSEDEENIFKVSEVENTLVVKQMRHEISKQMVDSDVFGINKIMQNYLKQ